MIVGVPKEVKAGETRVGLLPAFVAELCALGVQVWVEAGAGAGCGASDLDYVQAGAQLASSAAELHERAQLIVKVKEPQAQEWGLLGPQHLLFTYLHLAASQPLTQALLQRGSTCVAYETVRASDGSLPLLAPMSEVAGRLAVMAGAQDLQAPQGGKGLLLGGVPGVAAAQVLILGAGVVGSHAAAMAVGLGARVCVMDNQVGALRRLSTSFGAAVQTLYSTRASLQAALQDADLVIAGVLIPGAKAPKLINRAMLAAMKPLSVLVDVAIDQGGCAETSRPTTHAQPSYVEEGIIHRCVANLPAAVPLTATQALNQATLGHVLALALKGEDALREDPGLRAGLQVHAGRLTHAALALQMGLSSCTPEEALGVKA